MSTVKVIPLENLPRELEQIPERLREAAGQALSLEDFLELAKSLCPVETGALRSSIRAERHGPLTAVLVAGGGGFVNPRTGREVDYARHVHDGTSRQAPNPFLLQALHLGRFAFALQGRRTHHRPGRSHRPTPRFSGEDLEPQLHVGERE